MFGHVHGRGTVHTTRRGRGVTAAPRHAFSSRELPLASAGGNPLYAHVTPEPEHAFSVTGPQRDPASFGALYESLQPSLVRYLERLVGDGDIAEDVAQEAFLRLLRRTDLDGDDARLWIYTVATNLVRDHGRAVARRRRLLVARPVKPSAPPAPDVEAERGERVSRVRAALDRLPVRDRQLLLMREEGFRYHEMAEMVGVAPGSVGTLIARALKRFEGVYRGDESDDDAHR